MGKLKAPVDRIADCLRAEYGLAAAEIAPLALGADPDSTVHRVAAGGAEYFLKLRRGFLPASVTVPHWLAGQGHGLVIAPLPTRAGALWAELDASDASKVILYPYVHGRTGADVPLSPGQWRALGQGLAALHAAAPPPALAAGIPREGYAPLWRGRVAGFLEEAAGRTYGNPVAARLARLLAERGGVLRHVLLRAASLAAVLARNPPPVCLCHGDVHAWNVLAEPAGALRLVDWDMLSLAPKERDLLFVGGGVGRLWRDEAEVRAFYKGYGSAAVDLTALAYYRFERIVQDVGETCAEILAAEESDDRHELMVENLAGQFEPGDVVEIAHATDRRREREGFPG